MDALKPALLVSVAAILSLGCTQTAPPSQMAASAPAPQQTGVSEGSGPQQDPVVVSDHHMCEHAVRLIVNPLVARPGATLKIFSDHPLGYAPPIDVPDELLTRWRASPEGVATFSADGAQAVVSEAAVPGTTITLTANYCGKEEVSKTLPVYAKDQPVIVGFWKQESAECTEMAVPHKPIRELVFEALGGFSVTYQPFESYKDYWGTHTFDYRTGALDVTVTGGNAEPEYADLSGTAKLENPKRLVLDGLYLGQKGHPEASCRYVFVK
jgi:hypothetical protein